MSMWPDSPAASDGLARGGDSLPSPVGPRRPSRVWRAGVGLTILGLLSAGIWLLQLASPDERPLAERMLALAGSTPFPIAMLIAGSALRARQRWAVAGLSLLVAAAILTSIVTIVVDLQSNKLTIPFSLLVVLWVLAAPLDADATATPTGRTVMIGALMVIGALGPSLVDAALTPGRGLVAGENDLSASLTVDCGAIGEVPERVVVHYAWTWSKAELIVGGQDQVSIGWTSQDAVTPDESVYILGDVPAPEPAVYAGVSGSPNSALGQPFTGRFDGGSWDWTIDVDARGSAPGQIDVVLLRARPATTATLDVQAIYVHRGRWGAESNIASCSW